MTLCIREIRTTAEYASLREDWNRLAKLEGSGVHAFDVSATFEWAEALWLAFPDRAPKCILVAQDDSGIRGLMPCTISADTLAQVKHLRMTPTLGIYDLRTGFLVGGDASVLAKLLAHALKGVDGWDALLFRVVDSSPSDRAQSEALRLLGLRALALREWRTPFIELPTDAEQLMQRLSQKLLSNVRRAERQLLKQGKLRTQFYEDEASTPEFLKLMADVEARSWKMKAGTAMVLSDGQQRMYEAVTPAMARCGRFLGAALFLDELPLAFIYGYAWGGVFVDEKESYDEAFKDYGPGNVLKTGFLQELVRRGLSAHDYGGNEDPHKARWTDKSYSRQSYLLTNKTLRGRLLLISLKARRHWHALIRRFSSTP